MRLIAVPVLLVTLTLWAGNWIVGRAVREAVAPGLATAGRLLIVIAILAPFCARALARALPALSARDWRLIAALAFFGGGVHLALQWLGLRYTTATSGVLYLSTSPLFILLLARPVLGEAVGVRQWLGVALSFAGVAVIAAEGDWRRLAALSFNVGDVLALTSMAMWAAYTVLLPRRRDALTTVQFLVLLCLLGLGWLAPWLAVEAALGALAAPDAVALAAMLYSGVGSLLVAYAGWSWAVERLGAARAGVTIHLVPAIGVGLAALFLDERPQPYHGGGIALVLAGVTLANLRSATAVRSP